MQYEPTIRDKHISLFAIAPQPLLFKMGTLLNRNYDVDVRQSQGDISSWRWQSDAQSIELRFLEPLQEVTSEKVVLTIEITAKLSDEEIKGLAEKYGRIYPYPYETEYATLEFDDIGHSDRVLCLGVERKDD